MTGRSRRVSLLLAVATVSWFGSARADENADSKAAAQVLFEEGRSLVGHNQFAEACPKFAESQRLDPGIGTQLWLADCYENNGQTASAWATFKEAAAEAAMRHDKREEVARQRAAALEARLPRLMVIVSSDLASHGLEVRRDGLAVAPTTWGLALPVDPGVHTIAASAQEREPWSTTVQVPAGGETLQVTIPALVQRQAPAAATAAPAPSSTASTEQPRKGRGDGQRLAAGIVAGIGGAALGAGTFFAFDSKSTYDSSNQGGHCDAANQCDATGKAARSQANDKALAATLSMGLGVAAMAGGAVLYLIAPRGEKVAVAVRPEAAGVTLGASFVW